MFSSPLGGILIPWSTISIVGLVVAFGPQREHRWDPTKTTNVPPVCAAYEKVKKRNTKKRNPDRRDLTKHMVQYDMAGIFFGFLRTVNDQQRGEPSFFVSPLASQGNEKAWIRPIHTKWKTSSSSPQDLPFVHCSLQDEKSMPSDSAHPKMCLWGAGRFSENY